MKKLLSADEFREAAQAGQVALDQEVQIVIASSGTPKAEGDRTFRFTFSDGSVDRMTDTIDPKGWDLTHFNKNPVALAVHASSDLTAVIGKAKNVGIVGKKLMGDIEFMPGDVNPLAEMAYRMVDGGWINAVSVGFRPTKYAFSEEKDRPWGIDFKEQELLEISLVPIPANPNALLSAKAAGVDFAPLRTLYDTIGKTLGDVEETIQMPRALARQWAKGALPQAIRERYFDGAAEVQWVLGAEGGLPFVEAETYDASEAAARMFLAAGSDFALLRRGFLIYDPARPTERDAYAVPIGDIIGGELHIVSEALRRAPGSLARKCASAAVQQAAFDLITAYETKKGRRISAASAALIGQAVEHHRMATDCLNAVLNQDAEEASEDDKTATVEDKEAERQTRLRKARAVQLAVSLED